jgi:hypothetical protein
VRHDDFQVVNVIAIRHHLGKIEKVARLALDGWGVAIPSAGEKVVEAVG